MYEFLELFQVKRSRPSPDDVLVFVYEYGGREALDLVVLEYLT